MYDIFTKQILYNAYDKETAQILSRTNDNLIKKSVFYENSNQFLIAFIVGKYDLIFYYVYGQRDDETNEQSEISQNEPNILIRRFPTIKEHGEIRDIALGNGFNLSGDNIYILFEIGIIVSLSILELTEQFQTKSNVLDLNANLICSKSICSPTNIIIWYSFDGQQEIAIVGNDLGEICFINIDKKQFIRKTSIKKSVKNLRIIRDKFTVTLLITAADNSQLKLPLEENRLSLILNQDNDADNIKFMQENRYKLFSCFIVYNTAQLPEIDEDKINIKPVPVEIEIKKKNCSISTTNLLNSITSNNLLLNNEDKLNCILINQQSFILATYYQENANLASINIYEGNEFTYEFTTPLSKYCFPKECVSLDNIIELVTERLIITANHKVLFIISKQYSDFRRENIDNSIISFIEFDSKILNIFRLNENQIDNYLDTLIVVTSQCAYKLRPKMSCENIFIELLSLGNRIGNQLNNHQSNPNQFNLININNNKLRTNPISPGHYYYSAHEFAFMLRLNLNNLYKRTTHYFLQNKQYQKALDLFNSENITKLELIKNFLFYGYLNEAINIISHLFEEKNYDLDDQDKVSFANVYVACSIQRILEKRVMNEKNLNKLKIFLISNIYYNEQYVIKLLTSSYMFNLAKLCASIRNNYACLVRNLLNVEQVQRELLNNDFYDKINQSIYNDVLVEPFRTKDYFKCLLTKDILQGFFIESDLISVYLKLLIETLPRLDNRLLKKASRLFDPRQPQVQLFLNNVVSKLNLKYTCYASSTAAVDEQFSVIQKKDIINFFIFVNLIILKNQNTNIQFDERVLELLQKKKCNKSLNNNNHKEYFNELEYNYSINEQDPYQVSAGQSRGFLIKHGNLFSFGSAKYGADAEVNINCNKQSFEPKLNSYFSDLLAIKVIGVSSGAHHTLILTKISCYAVGQSIYGQLGCGNQIQYTRYPKVIKKLQKLIIQKLVCGQYHSFALTVDGRLLSWGWGTHGQLGHGDTETIYEPKLIKYFKTKQIVDVSAGYCHSIVLDSDGIVYSFGSNVYGQLGCEDEKLKKRNIPEPIYLIDGKIDLISSKYFQCLAFSKESRTIYYFGTSPQNNQLMAQQLKKMRSNQQQQNGNENSLNHSTTTTNAITKNNNEHKVPRKLKVDFDVKKLETGNLHSMLLTDEGKVHSWGRGPEGQMGHGCEKSIVLPTLINDFLHPIVDIACGYDFSLCVDCNGELYSFGQNIDHQLGFITKFEPKTSLNGVNNLLENKKLRIKNKKVLTMLSSKQVEKVPVRVEFKNENSKKLSYLDSVTIDFTTLKKQKSLEKENIKVSRSLDHLEFNNFSLCKIIYKLRHELDLRLILNTCLSLNSYLCCGFIYELLKEPLNALEFYLKAAFSNHDQLNNTNGHISSNRQQFDQIKAILNYFILKYMSTDQVIFKSLILKFFKIWLINHRAIEELETILIEIYEEKVNNFVFGLFLFELMEKDELEICLSNEFKIKLMKLTCKYLKSAKINEFMVEPVTSLLSSMSSNENLLSAEALWKNILNNIQKELDKNRKSSQIKKNGVDHSSIKSLDDQIDDNNYELNEGIEIIPEDNQLYIFSCNHHFNKDYFSSILLKQLEIINSDLNSHDPLLNGNSNKLNQINFKANSSSRCPLCSNI